MLTHFIAVKCPPTKERAKVNLHLRFCLPFDNHNLCLSCREANIGDNLCVTFEAPCKICSGFSEEQMSKIKNRKHYVRKQKADISKDELDFLGDEDMEFFTGSQADLEGAADNLFVSSPRPQPLSFESLSLKIPAKSVPQPRL